MNCSLPVSSVHGDSPGKNTGVGCHFLLQGIFPTPGSNLRLPHWQADSLPLSHQESTIESLKYAIFFLQLYIVTSLLLNIRIVSEVEVAQALSTSQELQPQVFADKK